MRSKLSSTSLLVRRSRRGVVATHALVVIAWAFYGLCLILAPHMTIFGFILSLILGYQFSFTKLDEDFASDNLEKMVRKAVSLEMMDMVLMVNLEKVARMVVKKVDIKVLKVVMVNLVDMVPMAVRNQERMKNSRNSRKPLMKTIKKEFNSQ